MYLGEKFKSRFKSDAEWFEFYGDVKEDVTIDEPTPYGKYWRSMNGLMQTNLVID